MKREMGIGSIFYVVFQSKINNCSLKIKENTL